MDVVPNLDGDRGNLEIFPDNIQKYKKQQMALDLHINKVKGLVQIFVKSYFNSLAMHHF